MPINKEKPHPHNPHMPHPQKGKESSCSEINNNAIDNHTALTVHLAPGSISNFMVFTYLKKQLKEDFLRNFVVQISYVTSPIIS